MNYKKGSVAMLVIVVALILIGVFYFVGKDNVKSLVTTEDHVFAEDDKVMMEQDSKKDDSVVMQKPEGREIEQKAISMKAGFYEVYSTESFSQFMRSWSGDTKVVLFFNASWCPSCQALHKELLGYSLPAGVAVFSVDYDKFPELKKKYGVTYQHTLVQVDANSGLIKKWSGGDVAKIISEVK
jgi:thiol-disulfide isomerase/thioredoxin